MIVTTTKENYSQTKGRHHQDERGLTSHKHTRNEAHWTKTAKQAHWENIHISSSIYAPGTDCHLALGAKGVRPGEGGDKAHKPHTQYWGHDKSFN